MIVGAKVEPHGKLDGDQLTRAMDDLDRRIRLELPLVSDVFIDLTANRSGGDSSGYSLPP